jgi:hypothetical protein
MAQVSNSIILYRNRVINNTQYPLQRSIFSSTQLTNLRGENNINGTNTIINRKTGIFIITFDPIIQQYKVLFARKCYAGERAQVGHKDTRNIWRTNWNSLGAAGTHRRYWGKWVSIGGTNSSNATSQLHAANLEYEDETAVNTRGDARRYLTYLHGINTSGVYIYIAYLPYSRSNALIAKSKRKLIFSSHGEIAELTWRPFSNYGSNVANYVQNSYNTILVPYISSLPLYTVPVQQIPLVQPLEYIVQLIKGCNQ